MKLALMTVGVFIMAVICVGLSAQVAYAHVLVPNQDATKGAILHIIPDDEPIAGEEATLLFDTQSGLLGDDSRVTLTVLSGATSETKTVAVKRDGSLVSAQYIFPMQGVYTLAYTVESQGEQSVFSQTIRISRGVEGGAANAKQYPWAEALLFITGACFVMLLIVGWNRRKAIFKASTF